MFFLCDFSICFPSDGGNVVQRMCKVSFGSMLWVCETMLTAVHLAKWQSTQPAIASWLHHCNMHEPMDMFPFLRKMRFVCFSLPTTQWISPMLCLNGCDGEKTCTVTCFLMWIYKFVCEWRTERVFRSMSMRMLQIISSFIYMYMYIWNYIRKATFAPMNHIFQCICCTRLLHLIHKSDRLHFDELCRFHRYSIFFAPFFHAKQYYAGFAVESELLCVCFRLNFVFS